MSEKWKWSFTEAVSVILATYAEDWGKEKAQRTALLQNPNISEINHPHITGLQSGEGQAVIFIHGSPANALRWKTYLEKPPQGYQIIAIDRMGFGNRGKQIPNLEEDAKRLNHFIEQFKKPILVGHSLGGAHAVRLATQSNIKGLVLVASSIDPMLERILTVQKIGNMPPFRWLLSRSVRHSNAEMMQLFDYMMQTESHLGKISASVHVVHAKDDYLVPFSHTEYARKYFKDIEATEIDEGGHIIPWTRPELVIEAIKSVGGVS